MAMEYQKRQTARYDSSNPYAAYPVYEEQVKRITPEGSRRVQSSWREENYRQRRDHNSDYGSSSDEDEDDLDNDRYRRRRRHSTDEVGPVRRSRSVDYNTSRHERSREKRRHDPRPPETYTITKAVKSAAMAAGVEAVRCRNEPGPWRGQKGVRVATAAVSGCMVGALRNGSLKRDGKLPIAEAAFTGIYAIDFLKRVLRQTDHEKGADEDRRKYVYESDDEDEDRRESRRLKQRSRTPSPVRSRSLRRRSTKYD